MIGQQVVLFEVAGVVCALEHAAVRELLPIVRLWRPPATPSTVAGILDLNGAAVPVLRLNRLLGLADGDDDDIYRHLILVDGAVPGLAVALLVDRVLDVIKPDGQVVAPGHATLNACVTAEIAHCGALVHLVAIDRILMTAEQQGVAELAQAAATRLAEWRQADG